MRTILPPNETPSVVYQICIDSIADQSLQDRLNSLNYDITLAASDYQKRAAVKQLYTLPANDCANDDIVLGSATKKELKDVYSVHMVGKAKPARLIYDSLLSRAPFGLCPFCGIGYVSTLDHYLPKTKYPQLSVVPLNLIPSCKDCNTGKNTSIATTEDTQILHPYFDHENFINDQWLFADVIQASPVTIQFYVQAPAHWDDISKKRVQVHFEDFKLASRYSNAAASRISCLRDTLCQHRKILGLDWIKQHLEIEAQTHLQKHKNSWETAMFQSLAGSDWYCRGGFL